VSRRGGTTLLTGVGPDVYLPVTAAHVPDLIWQGHLRQAASELCRWSVATRSSLWRVLARDAIAPLLRPGLRHWGGFGKDATASWLTRRFWRAADMAHRLDTRPVAMRRGRQYDTEVGWMLSLTGGALASTWNVAPAVRMRHPLMDQRLVRFVLGLPASMRTDTYRTKPLLRAAMRGILPESVRLRTTKGSILTAHLCGSFARERRRLAQLLTSPVLGDVGVIEPRELLDAVDRAATGRRQDVGLIYAALALETWLSVRSGRWGRSLPQ
jgi:asparagine synthase (glutamine-hydrolysing)